MAELDQRFNRGRTVKKKKAVVIKSKVPNWISISRYWDYEYPTQKIKT